MEKIRKKRIWPRVLAIVLAAIVFIVACVAITFTCVWWDEISTVSSFRHIRSRNDANKEGSVYSMNVSGGFYFDDFLEGGGASSDSELIDFITGNITRGLVDIEIGETDIGCSSFIARAENGDILFGRNYDFDKTNVCLTMCDPGEGRYKSFSTVDLNYVGITDTDRDVSGLIQQITCLAAPYAPLDGINEKGVSCGIFMSYQGPGDGAVSTDQQDVAKDNITSTTMLRMVLDYAATTDEAVELISGYNLHDSANTSFHYMIADATGRSAILEWVPEGVTDSNDTDGSARSLNVIYNDDPMYAELLEGSEFRFQTITNFIITPGYYDGEDQPADEKGEGAQKGLDRYDYINGVLGGTGGIVKDEEAAMDILRAVGRRTWNGGGGVTVHSAVYNLTKKTVLWVANENFDYPSAIWKYDLASGTLTSLADAE